MISIWNRNGKDQAIVERIRQGMMEHLNLPEDVKMSYELFNVEQKPPAGG
jgi:hypothetical protein